jgi:hypothetical protein
MHVTISVTFFSLKSAAVSAAQAWGAVAECVDSCGQHPGIDAAANR